MGNRRGQSVAEYAILVGVVVAAIVGMQVYVKRSLQGKVKAVADSFATDASGVVSPLQYEPYYTGAGETETKVVRQKATEKMTAGGRISRTGIDEETTRTTPTATKQGADLAADDAWK